MKIRRRLAFHLFTFLLLLIATIASAADFTSVGAGRELKGAPGIYEWTFQATVGKSPFDKIALHRVAKGPTPPAHPDAVVLYLPGTNMNGEVALDDPRYSFQVYLAAQGVDVWSMDYRTHFIPPETPESDLAELAGWTNDLFESDIDAAAKFVSRKIRPLENLRRRLQPRRRVRLSVCRETLSRAHRGHHRARRIHPDSFDAHGTGAAGRICRGSRRQASDLRQTLHADADGDRKSRSARADSEIQNRAREPRACDVRWAARPAERLHLRICRAAIPTRSCSRSC